MSPRAAASPRRRRAATESLPRGVPAAVCDEFRHFTPGQVAKLLNVSDATIRNAIRRGNLRATRVEGQHRIHLNDLRRYLGAEAPPKNQDPGDATPGAKETLL